MKGSLSGEVLHLLESKHFDQFKLIAAIYALVEDNGSLYV